MRRRDGERALAALFDSDEEPSLVIGAEDAVVSRNAAATDLLGEGPVRPEWLAGGEAMVDAADGWPVLLRGEVRGHVSGYRTLRLRDVTLARCREAADRLTAGHGALLAVEPDPVLAVGDLGRIVYANPAVEALLGYGAGAVIGVRMDAVFGRTTATGVRGFLAAYSRVAGEGAALRCDGTSVPVEADLRRIGADVERFIAVRLRAPGAQVWGPAEAEVRLLLAGVHGHGIFLLGPDGRVATWNAAAARATGYSAGEIVGQPCEVLYVEEERAAGHAAANMARAAAEGVLRMEAWRRSRDGGRFWADVTLTALRDEAGQLRGFAKVLCDASARRRAAEAQRALDAAEARNRFVRTVAHELRNPLASVKAITHLAARRARAGQAAATQAATLAVLVNEVDRLAALVNELLEVAQAPEVSPRPVDLIGLIAGIWPGPVESTAGGVPVAGDADKLRTVFLHLLANARKFSPRGGSVRVRVDRRGGCAEVTVADEGIGIPPDELERVFEGFHRGSNLDGHDPGGLGLGLHIAREIVRAHGGRIWAESGAGTTLHVELPLANGTHPAD